MPRLVFMNSGIVRALCLLMCISVPAGAVPIKRDDIVGVWRLVRIDFARAGKSAKDPDFGSNPSGQIIYVGSGWMGVQIVTAPRPMLPKTQRTSGTNSPTDAQAKAAAMDSYYAYYGRWAFDAAKSVVHHQLTASLLPFETGTEKPRDVAFDGRRLSLTVHGPKGEDWTRILVWERQP